MTVCLVDYMFAPKSLLFHAWCIIHLIHSLYLFNTESCAFDGVANFSVYGVAILVLIAKPNGLGLWCTHQQRWTVSKWYLSLATFSFTKLYISESRLPSHRPVTHRLILPPGSRWFFQYLSSPMQTLGALMVRRIFLPIASPFTYSSVNLDFKALPIL